MASPKPVKRFLNQVEPGFYAYYRKTMTSLGLSQEQSHVPIARLELIIRRLGIPLDDLFEGGQLLDPWNRLNRQSVVVVALGERYVKVPECGAKVKQPMIGLRDAQAYSVLQRFLERRLDCRLEMRPVPPGGGGDFYQKASSERSVAAIISIGSEMVNPATTVLAKEILNDYPEADTLPARFCLSVRVKDAFLSYSKSKRQAQGITTLCDQHFPREPDDLVSKRLNSDDLGPFPDCGMILLDQRRPTLLAVLAGHGGCGTIACTLALKQEIDIHGALNCVSNLGMNRAWKVVTVRRRRPKRRDEGADAFEVDDLDFDRTYKRGWRMRDVTV